jgi:hypothetical protein
VPALIPIVKGLTINPKALGLLDTNYIKPLNLRKVTKQQIITNIFPLNRGRKSIFHHNGRQKVETSCASNTKQKDLLGPYS